MITILKNDSLEIGISDFGAELQYIRGNDGTEYLWDASDGALKLRAPVLFPFVSFLPGNSFIYQGKKYETPFTGFAHDMTFDLLKSSDTEAEYILTSTDETLKMYPFGFSLKMKYILDGRSLKTEITVDNIDDKTMYFSLGWHPVFRVPMEDGCTFDDYRVTFDEKCAPKKIVRDKGLDSGAREQVILKDDQVLSLNDAMFENDLVKVITDSSKTVTLDSSKSKHGVKVSFPDMEHLVLFHKPGVPFITIEAWTSLMAEKDKVYDLENALDLIRLECGECYSNNWEVRLLEKCR